MIHSTSLPTAASHCLDLLFRVCALRADLGPLKTLAAERATEELFSGSCWHHSTRVLVLFTDPSEASEAASTVLCHKGLLQSPGALEHRILNHGL